VENALAATQAAVEEGVVPGGGVAYVRSLPALDSLKLTGDEAVATGILRQALVQPLRIIAANAGQEEAVVLDQIRQSRLPNFGYDAQGDNYGDMVAKGIIDPAKVVRIALQNAASVAGMVLTTESLVTEEKTEAPDAGHGHMH
jgi:chaperonin GroEL